MLIQKLPSLYSMAIKVTTLLLVPLVRILSTVDKVMTLSKLLMGRARNYGDKGDDNITLSSLTPSQVFGGDGDDTIDGTK